MGFFELDTEVAEAARKAWEKEEKMRTPGKE